MIKRKTVLELPVYAATKKFIVLKLSKKYETEIHYPEAYTPINQYQWEYTLPYQRKDILGVQFNDNWQWITKLKVKCECPSFIPNTP